MEKLFSAEVFGNGVVWSAKKVFTVIIEGTSDFAE